MPSATFGFIGNPVSTEVKSGAYTIPAGYYAYVTAHVSATACGSFYAAGSSADSSAASDSQSASFWVPPGTDLDSNKTDASASGTGAQQSESSARFLIDTVVAMEVYARVRLTSAAETVVITGTSFSKYTVQLFEE